MTARDHTARTPAGNDVGTEPVGGMQVDGGDVIQSPPADLIEQMESLTVAVFQSGMSAAVVSGKWDGIAAAFAGFDPVEIAAMTPSDADRLVGDPRVIRNRRKIEATIENASRLLALESQFGFSDWLGSRGDLEATVRAISDEFEMVGPHGARLFLQKIGHQAAEIGGDRS